MALRDARRQGEGTSKLVLEGVLPGKYAPRVFAHFTGSRRCVVHGDEFTFAGLKEGLEWAPGKTEYLVRREGGGSGARRLPTARR